MAHPILVYTTSFTMELPLEMLPWRSELLEAFSRRMEGLGTVEHNPRRRKNLVYTFALKEARTRQSEGPSIDYLASCLTLDVYNVTRLGVSLIGNAKGR